MKKLVYAFGFILVACFASCGNKAASTDAAAAADSVEVVTVVEEAVAVDTLTGDTVVEVAAVSACCPADSVK